MLTYKYGKIKGAVNKLDLPFQLLDIVQKSEIKNTLV